MVSIQPSQHHFYETYQLVLAVTINMGRSVRLESAATAPGLTPLKTLSKMRQHSDDHLHGDSRHGLILALVPGYVVIVVPPMAPTQIYQGPQGESQRKETPRFVSSGKQT